MPSFNYAPALEKAYTAARSRDRNGFVRLGARVREDGVIELPVLGGVHLIDLEEGKVFDGGGEPTSLPWTILSLHYLLAEAPFPASVGWTSFSDMADVRSYLGVYQKRVVDRLCATAGRNREVFERASLRLGATAEKWGDCGFRYPVFPLVPIGVAWYAGDEDMGPGASVLFPGNIRAVFVPEDTIVLGESLVWSLGRAERDQ